MSFKPGDRVVYPHHGAAVIEKKEKRKAFGEETEYLVLRMAHGEMTLAVPVDKADEVGMRWPISEEDVEDLFEVLAKRDVREPANWSRRFKNHQENSRAATSTRSPRWSEISLCAIRPRGCLPVRSPLHQGPQRARFGTCVRARRRRRSRHGQGRRRAGLGVSRRVPPGLRRQSRRRVEQADRRPEQA